jgi:hypothetical protein
MAFFIVTTEKTSNLNVVPSSVLSPMIYLHTQTVTGCVQGCTLPGFVVCENNATPSSRHVSLLFGIRGAISEVQTSGSKPHILTEICLGFSQYCLPCSSSNEDTT